MNREDHCARVLKDFGLLVISGRIKANVCCTSQKTAGV